MAILNIIPGKAEGARVTPLKPGMRTDESGKPVKNIILLAIADHEFNILRSRLEPVELPRHFIMNDPGQAIHDAYFLNDGMTSLVVLTKDGRSVEVGIVGREGMVGIPLTAGLKRGSFQAIMQIGGSGLRISSDDLLDALSSSTELGTKLGQYVLMHGLQVGQIAACNRLHEVDQRLARWLLMCQDRVDSAFLPLTHEFLAQMLGTGRPSVSLAAAILEQSGLIENHRGRVRIINRKNLEAAACECYDVIQQFNGELGLR